MSCGSHSACSVASDGVFLWYMYMFAATTTVYHIDTVVHINKETYICTIIQIHKLPWAEVHDSSQVDSASTTSTQFFRLYTYSTHTEHSLARRTV